MDFATVVRAVRLEERIQKCDAVNGLIKLALEERERERLIFVYWESWIDFTV